MKANIVMRDEMEQGERALLNLGHTFCHALEAATGYSDRLLHGEGVAIGCALAFETSAQLGLCSQETPSRVRKLLKQLNMKTDIADIKGELPDAQSLLDLMGQDKKVVAGKLRFIMARDIGAAFVTSDVDHDVRQNCVGPSLGPTQLKALERDFIIHVAGRCGAAISAAASVAAALLLAAVTAAIIRLATTTIAAACIAAGIASTAIATIQHC